MIQLGETEVDFFWLFKYIYIYIYIGGDKPKANWKTIN